MGFIKKVVSMILVVIMLITGGLNLSTLEFDKNSVHASSVSSNKKDSDYVKAKKDLKKIEKEIKKNRSKIKRDLDYSERNSTNNPQVSTRAAVVAVPVAVYVIPFIGTVVVEAGKFIVAGVIVGGGTWLYTKIKNWIAASNEKDYQEAKKKGVPTKDHEVVEGQRDLPKTGKPNASKDLKDTQGVKQRRYYDKNGNADMDIDYRHGGVGHKFPHKHYWPNGVRGKDINY